MLSHEPVGALIGIFHQDVNFKYEWVEATLTLENSSRFLWDENTKLN